MTKPDPIKINVDPTNPGQFFACCGLLELADRLWDGAEGAFSASGAEFSVRRKESPSKDDATQLRCALASCAITSTMSEDQIARLKKLLNQKKATLTPQEAAEKQELSELWERERISASTVRSTCGSTGGEMTMRAEATLRPGPGSSSCLIWCAGCKPQSVRWTGHRSRRRSGSRSRRATVLCPFTLTPT